MAGAFAYAYYKVYSVPKVAKNTKTTKAAKPKQQVKDNVSSIPEMEGVYNILLIGVDARSNTFTGNTDSMIVLTFDKNNHVIKLTSLMRDMYVDIPGYESTRINAAFSLGGPELLSQTIKQNFGFSVDKYAIVNFQSFQKIINDLGGVNINVKPDEISLINSYQKSVNGDKSVPVTHSGMQLLNGEQALGYSRIRYVGNNDFERTERQRNVITALMEKSRTVTIWKFPKIVYDMLPYIKTNVPVKDLVSLAYTVYKDKDFTVEQYRLPGDGMYKDETIRGMAVLVPDLEKCREALSDFLSK